MRPYYLTLILLLAAFPCAAEFEFQTGADGGPEIKKTTAPAVISIDPFAAALGKEMLLSPKSTDYWELIGFSSTNAPVEINQYMRRGYGRLEITTLVLIAGEAREKLADITKKRSEKKGKRLRELAEEYKLDYASVSQKAKTLKEKAIAQSRTKLEDKGNGNASGRKP